MKSAIWRVYIDDHRQACCNDEQPKLFLEKYYHEKKKAIEQFEKHIEYAKKQTLRRFDSKAILKAFKMNAYIDAGHMGIGIEKILMED